MLKKLVVATLLVAAGFTVGHAYQPSSSHV